MKPIEPAGYARDPVAFLDALVRVNELGQPFRLLPHQREILSATFTFDADGRLPWDTLLYSCLKKDGKTTINAALTLWWAFTQEAPNEVYILANDQEQAQSRVFATIAKLIRNNPALAASAVSLDTRRIVLTNGTTIIALASEYAGAAGSNHGLTSWDELWAYTSEGSRRLWEELTPVPTRRNSLRIITTYAGWENESLLLWDLYKAGVLPAEHPDGQGERLHPTLPLYANREARQITYWDHEPRAPWQSARYRESQRRTLRPGAFLRFFQNQWAVNASTFLTPELVDPCVDPTARPCLPDTRLSIWAGVDLGIKSDNASVQCVTREGNQLRRVTGRLWRPTAAEPLDIEHTVEAYLRDLNVYYRLQRVLVDPYQAHRSITTLQAAGLPIQEFPQTPANTTRMGQTLFDLLSGRNLVLYPDPELRAQALNTVAIESPRGFRIAKEKASKKIDAIVALSMACVAALDDAAEPPKPAFYFGSGDGKNWATRPAPPPPPADEDDDVLETTPEELAELAAGRIPESWAR